MSGSAREHPCRPVNHYGLGLAGGTMHQPRAAREGHLLRRPEQRPVFVRHVDSKSWSRPKARRAMARRSSLRVRRVQTAGRFSRPPPVRLKPSAFGERRDCFRLAAHIKRLLPPVRCHCFARSSISPPTYFWSRLWLSCRLRTISAIRSRTDDHRGPMPRELRSCRLFRKTRIANDAGERLVELVGGGPRLGDDAIPSGAQPSCVRSSALASGPLANVGEIPR